MFTGSDDETPLTRSATADTGRVERNVRDPISSNGTLNGGPLRKPEIWRFAGRVKD
jgi:hypothetical protein